MLIHLLRMRLGFFKNQTRGLYERYIDVGFLLALLFAPALFQAPSLVAYPLLAFFDHPFDTWRNLVPLLAWLGLSVVWARIHRHFIRGGQLAQFVHTMPLSELELRLVDLAILMVGMFIFAVPVGFAAWTAFDAGPAAGADGRFWFYLVLLAMLSLSLARDVVYGSVRHVRLVQLLAICVLLSPAASSSVLRAELVLCVLAAALGASMVSARHDTPPAAHACLAWMEKFTWCPPLVFLLNNFRRFLTTQWHDSVSRVLWAILPLAFSWWMIVKVGKHHDAALFVHAALGCFSGILAGCYRPLLDGRSRLTAYARSIGYGERMLALADHLLVLVLASFLLLPWLALFAAKTTLFSGGYLLKLVVFYTALLVLLGTPWIQLHKRSVIVKFAGATLGMLIAGTLL
ncbi:hypothetical protein [Massilia sp. H6]|uniref:hypothetical protein n=1 Tax=Massilia sp. H6 TaxID=2970464 RepID=UPI002169F159|nr:hypothetical protein [Massilia sp. H6]UVW28862.1 hypothetical protein NRS07_01545 [Massilia sp. H6]